MTIETKTVKEGRTTHFSGTGLAIKYRNRRLKDAFRLTVRRHKEEFVKTNIVLDELEDTMSDYFVCRLGQARDTTPITLSCPMFNKLDETQDTILKTGNGREFGMEKCSLSDDEVCIDFSCV